MTWVRFHEQLCQDEKVGIPRAHRFVYMELSLKARPRRGYIILPSGLSDVKAVQAILPAGNSREVADAINTLSAGDDPMIAFDNIDGKRVLVVVSWEKWNPSGDDSRERVRDWRAKQKKRKEEQAETGDGNALHEVTETEGDALVTPRARALLSSVSSSDLSPSEKIPAGSERSTNRNATGDRAGGLAVAAWQDGVRSVTDRPCVVAVGGPMQALVGALLEHCPDDNARVDFAREKGATYARYQMAAGLKIKPHDFGDWLNSNSPERPSGVRRAGPAVQPPPAGGKRHWKEGEST